MEQYEPITTYSNYVGRKLYGESVLDYKELYVYTVVGCGDFLSRDEDKIYPRIIIRNDTPMHDAIGYWFPIGRNHGLSMQDIQPDEIGKNYFFTKEEARNQISHKYKYVDVTKFNNKSIVDFEFLKIQTESRHDGYKYYHYDNCRYLLCSKLIDDYDTFGWYLCRKYHFGNKQLFGHSFASEGHIIHLDKETVNFWDSTSQ